MRGVYNMQQLLTKAIDNGSVILGGIAVLIIGGAVYLSATGQQVPDWMVTAVALILEYFFGTSTAPKQFRRDDAERIQRALYDTLPPHTKLDQLQAEFKREQGKEK